MEAVQVLKTRSYFVNYCTNVIISKQVVFGSLPIYLSIENENLIREHFDLWQRLESLLQVYQKCGF